MCSYEERTRLYEKVPKMTFGTKNTVVEEKISWMSFNTY
jgi:hypothetical protein